MEPNDWIALVAVLVGPLAALSGAWVNHALSERGRISEREERSRESALVGLAAMRSLLVDSIPSLVITNDLREYESPEQAVDGLYGRWLTAREPMVLLSLTHPDAEVRRLAFDLQAKVEMALRQTENAVHGGPSSNADDSHRLAVEQSVRLGELLSPYSSRP